jgi:hypothetical protein
MMKGHLEFFTRFSIKSRNCVYRTNYCFTSLAYVQFCVMVLRHGLIVPRRTKRNFKLFNYLLVFLCSRWCLSLLSGLFLPVYYIFHPSLVVELAHLGVQIRARRSTVMRRPYPSVDCERLSCCGFVLLARHILALNFIMTSMWSESMFAPPRAKTSLTSGKCLPSIKQ